MTPKRASRDPNQSSHHLRVLHLDAGREWRGGQRQVELLAAGLRAGGHEPLVVATPRSPLHQHIKALGLAVAAIKMRSAWDLLAVRKLRRLIATWRPAIVHAHDPRSHSLALTALVGRRNSIPLVVTRRAATRPRGLLRSGPRVSRFIAISAAVRDALRAGGIAPGRIALVYPGVNAPAVATPRDWRAECGWSADVVVAGLVGDSTLETATGLATGFATVERIARALQPASRARLRLVVLGGPASGLGAMGGVVAYRAGFVHDLDQAIAGLDLLLHPSAPKGLGTAVISAMALGVPPVAFDDGSLAEVIASGRDGMLVGPGDERAFASAVDLMVGDAALRARLSGAGPARAARFDPAHLVDETLAVYQGLLGGREGPRPAP